MSIIICIISGIFWAFFDLSRKITLKKISPFTLLIIFSLVQLIIFSIWINFENYQINFAPYIFPGLLLIIISIISAFLFLKALSISELGLSIPLLSFSPLFSTILSSIILDENLQKLQYFGIGLIIFGTLILYSRSFSIPDIFKSLTHIVKNKGARYMILVSLIWSLTPILDKICFKYSSMNIHGFIQSFGILIVLIMINRESFFDDLQSIRESFFIICITMLVGTIATIFQFFAISLTFVSIMESIKRSVGQVLSVIFGTIYFNEKINYQKILGVIILSLGVLVILYN